MLASELIRQLKALVLLEGDFSVVTEDESGFPVMDVYVGEDDNYDTVIVID